MRVYPQPARQGAHRQPGRAAGAFLAYIAIVVVGMTVASGVAILVRAWG